jgi:DNA-binding response OmpR family regulator
MIKSIEKLNVLIVEDEPLVSLFIKRIVLAMGENVVGVCYNSNDAIEMLRLQKPNLIFMDINLQGPIDGINIIKKVPMPHEPTIFFVSAYSDQTTINEALSTNPYNYLIKPIKEEEIQIAISLARKEQSKILSPKQERMIYSHEIYYDVLTKELFIRNEPFVISGVEKKLLDLFMNNLNQTLTIDAIKAAIWEEEKSTTTLRDLVSNLRKKLPELNLKTSFGVGYILVKGNF